MLAADSLLAAFGTKLHTRMHKILVNSCLNHMCSVCTEKLKDI